MRITALCVSFIVILMTAAFAIKATDPELYVKLSMSMDVIGLSPDSRQEQERIALINMLPISNEKKQILIERTIFLGASPAMVRLALGDPRDAGDDIEVYGQQEERWLYHFEKDAKPTALEFKDGKLTSAYIVE